MASLEAASGTGGAMEAVWSRVIPLVLKVRRQLSARSPIADQSLRESVAVSRSNLVIYGAKAVARAAARAA
jgi:hypothetical protein